MCGIVGAIAQRDVGEILLEGLRRLEYRGYDSAGVAIIDHKGHLQRMRILGKVSNLCTRFNEEPILGQVGIAHTRWATHGEPSEENAHPQQSHDGLALVHNGIIENHDELRDELKEFGYVFRSKTDTEVVVHWLHYELSKCGDFLEAVKRTVARLEGAYALAIVNEQDKDRLIAVRKGSPLVIGLGFGENFIASDTLALLPVTQRFIFLEEGDIAQVKRDEVSIWDVSFKSCERKIYTSEMDPDTVTKGPYRHFMQKEIFEQPASLEATLEGRLTDRSILIESFGMNAAAILKEVKAVQIIACGTSYHAGLVARNWIEELVAVPCRVEIASEFRYRKHVVLPGTLFVAISQSGETADTLAALRLSKEQGYLASLAICNAPESSLMRESDLVFMTRAGKEVGVASTKAFTTQLLSLLMLTFVLARLHGCKDQQVEFVNLLKSVPGLIQEVLELDERVKSLANLFADKFHALFLGRGTQFPIAMEGALKLKEISYIHAEAYAAGELKHGPLALVDKDMPVIAVAPNDELLEKLKSNLQEVSARGGQLIVFADSSASIKADDNTMIIPLPKVNRLIAPIVYTVPLQLLSYYVALIKGTDVDQPRNLAKSVTVE